MADLPSELTAEEGLSVSGGQIHFPESSCALCVKDKAILVVLQKRPRGISSYELPGGKMAQGETPVQAAIRELGEEAGLRAESGELLLTLDLDLSVSVHRTHLVDILGAFRGEFKGEFPTRWLPLEEGLRKVYSGEITHAPTVAAILLKNLEREQG
jgi:ADP-ribose pyrophosphatase